MCDCYTAECANCGCYINIHIADWCTERKNVIPYCHRCTRKILKGKIPPPDHCVTITEKVESSINGNIQGIKQGDMVVIYCKDDKAYGIHLN